MFEESRDRIESQEMVGDVRHSGMLMGIELVSDRESKTPVTASGSLNRILFEAARENGIYLRTLGNIILLVPPLAISEEELADLHRRNRSHHRVGKGDRPVARLARLPLRSPIRSAGQA